MASTEVFVPRTFVTQGSIYNPGWQVVEEHAPRQQRVLANFGSEDYSEAEARDYLAYIQEQS